MDIQQAVNILEASVTADSTDSQAKALALSVLKGTLQTTSDSIEAKYTDQITKLSQDLDAAKTQASTDAQTIISASDSANGYKAQLEAVTTRAETAEALVATLTQNVTDLTTQVAALTPAPDVSVETVAPVEVQADTPTDVQS